MNAFLTKLTRAYYQIGYLLEIALIENEFNFYRIFDFNHNSLFNFHYNSCWIVSCFYLNSQEV